MTGRSVVADSFWGRNGQGADMLDRAQMSLSAERLEALSE
jgi:hypothetical protein